MRRAPSPRSGARAARPVTLLDVPSNLGLRPPSPGAEPGVRGLAAALRGRGLAERLGAEDAGAIPVPAYVDRSDPATLFRNGPGIIEVSERLAEAVRRHTSDEKLLLVLGGDCSILVGAALGLRAKGRYGLVFIDGHDDFSPLRNLDDYRGWFGAAGMDLGIVTGHTPGGLSDIQGRKPYVREEDVVLFGFSREPDDATYCATELLETTRIHQLPVARVRALGPVEAARQALAALAEQPLDGVWVHLDADVLDRSVMPAVDSPNPDGLRVAQLEAALRVLLEAPNVVGMDVTIYDPEMDPGGVCGDRLADLLVAALRPGAPGDREVTRKASGP